MDIAPSVVLPTWNNRRDGCENICKRLDILLISVDLLEFNLCFHQWVGCGGESDHQPVFLQILGHDKILHIPFKFNPHSLEHEDFILLLKRVNPRTWVTLFGK